MVGAQVCCPCPKMIASPMTVFFAHNVGFDYRMVQSAFKATKCLIKPTLCTVKLAQALIPSSEIQP